MAIRLGRTISNPTFLLFQIAHGVSLFLVLIGVARVLLGVAELAIRSDLALERTANQTDTQLAWLQRSSIPKFVSQTTAPQQLYEQEELNGVRYGIQGGLRLSVNLNSPSITPTEPLSSASPAVSLSFFTKLSYCFHVPLESLFINAVGVSFGSATAANDAGLVSSVRREGNQVYLVEKGGPLLDAKAADSLPRHDGSQGRFFLQHIFAGLFCAYPLATLLQRRKLVLDFVGTIYFAYWVLGSIILRRVLWGGLHWWVSCLLGMIVLYSSTYLLCRRRELQEVRFSGDGDAGLDPSVPPTTAIRLAEIHTRNDEVREEVDVTVRKAQRQMNCGSVDVCGFSHPTDLSGRSRAVVPAQSSKWVKGVAVDANHSSEDVQKHKTV